MPLSCAPAIGMSKGPAAWDGHCDFLGVRVAVQLEAAVAHGSPRGRFRMMGRARPAPMSVPGEGCRVGPLFALPDELYSHGEGYISVCIRDEVQVASLDGWRNDLPRHGLLEAAVTGMVVAAKMETTVAAMLRTPSAFYLVTPGAEAMDRIINSIKGLSANGFAEISPAHVAKDLLRATD